MRSRLVVAALVVVLSVAGCSQPRVTVQQIPESSPSSGGFQPGADGLGDTYYPKAGNGGYDVGHYDLDVTYDPATDVIDGVATITATATANLSSFNLDFHALKTTSVRVDGVEAAVDHRGDELTITPAQGVSQGSTFTTTIAYSGVPQGFDDPAAFDAGFLTTPDGAIAIGEPEVASAWFPVNDHPRDKATYTIHVSAPDGLAALSNGVLTQRKPAARAGFTTWSWAVNAPMAPYLATMVVGNYRVQESTHDGMPVVLATHTSLPTTVDAQLARSGEALDFLETVFGPYPFDALGGIAINDSRIRFALENQTRPIYSQAFFGGGGDAMWVIVHELAHQWFGDSVSVNEWSEIWLNEGFATYAEWLWEEADGGATAETTFNRAFGNANSPLWSVPPGAPGKDQLFSGSVYNRGGMTLHALRKTVGDPDFFAILKAWAAEKRNSNATTAEFVALAERISGEQLDTLFDDWLYGTKRPPRP